MLCNNALLRSKALKLNLVLVWETQKFPCQHTRTREYEQQSKTNILVLGSLSLTKDLLLKMSITACGKVSGLEKHLDSMLHG